MADSLWSILICTHRRPAMLGDLLRSLAGELEIKRGPKVELVVVDNDPAESARSVVEAWIERGLPVRYVPESRPGVSHARNRAVDEAHGDVVFFLDDDQLLPLGSLGKLAREWDALEGTVDALCLRKVIKPEGPVSPWIGRPGTVGETDGLHLGPLRRTAMGTGGLLVKRRVLKSLPFDPALGSLGGEDVDFFLRAKERGRQFLYCDRPFVWERLPPERATLSYALTLARKKGMIDARLAVKRGCARGVGVARALGYLVAAVALLAQALLGGKAALGPALALVWRQVGKVQGFLKRSNGARGILFLTGGGQEGGAERLLEQISAHWHPEQGEAVFYFYDWKEDLSFIREIVARGFAVHRHQKRPGIDWRLWLNLYRVISTHGIAAIHTQDIGAMLHAAVMRMTKPRLRLVHTEHTLHYWIGVSKYRRLHLVLGSLYHRIACVSAFVQSELRSKVGTAAHRLTIVPNGVDLARFRRSEPGAPCQEGAPLRLASVGRIDDNKNLRQVIEGVACLRAKGCAVTLDHAGTGDARAVAEMSDLVAKLGLSHVVTLHGFKEDVRPLLIAADAFVSASRVECHPVAVLEAMALGLPCFLSDIPPHRDLAPAGNVLFDLTDQSLVAAIEAFAEDRSRLVAMGRVARQEVARSYSLDAMLRRYHSLYAPNA